MPKKLPDGVSFLDSCRIAQWFERIRDKLGNVSNPKGISAGQINAWVKFYHYEFDLETKQWFKQSNDKPKEPPKEQRDEEE